MNFLKNWFQKKDPKTLAFGFLLLICSAFAIVGLLTKGYTSYYLSGAILFAFLGIAMMRKSKRY